MYGDIISALKKELDDHAHSALKQRPTDVLPELYLGLSIGKYQGLQRALNVIEGIAEERDKRDF